MANWKKNPKIGVILVVVIAIFVGMTYQKMKPKKYYYTTDFKCEQCENVFNAKIYGGQKLPLKCPKCDKAAAYRALRCTDCGFVFTMKPQVPPKGPGAGGPPMPMMDMPKCPQCGSMKLGPVTPREPLPEPKD